jgi:membrane protease subunit HflC
MKIVDSNSPEGSGPSRRRGRVPSPAELAGWGRRLAAGGLVLLIIPLAILLAAMGKLGVVSISSEEVAVKMNYITGNREVITNPGYRIFLPFIEEVFKLDRTPQKFEMVGDRATSHNRVPFLTVRAKDGSNFSFDELEIQYSIIPGDTDKTLDDSGPGDGFKREWIRAFARSVLRDEFGKYSAVEVADPTSYQAARIASEDRLREMLAAHGVEVIQVICPKPRFDSEYEQAIEDRKVADQEVEKLREEEGRLMNERERLMASATKEKEIEWQSLRGSLRKTLLNAEQRRIELEKGADAYAVERGFAAKAENAQLEQRARGLTARYTKEAQGILARVEALENRGQVVVREALIEKLKSINFTLVPYSRDPVPKRLEHVNSRDGVLLLEDAQRSGGDR